MMNQKSILLVEDNPDDAELTLRAFRKNNIHNDIQVAQDGVEAIASNSPVRGSMTIAMTALA